MRHTFLFVTVKIWLKSSVYIYGSYRKIKTGFSLFWTTLYLCVQYIPSPTWSNHTEVVRLQALSVKFVMQSIFSKNSVGCQWTAELTTRSLFFATRQSNFTNHHHTLLPLSSGIENRVNSGHLRLNYSQDRLFSSTNIEVVVSLVAPSCYCLELFICFCALLTV